ncbi:MAG: endonuclease MutS2, partial [Limnochordia bacterium]
TQRILQDNLITLRNGRYVLPVRQEYRSSLPGIVHDQSGSGATLFIEPIAVVELNNEIRQVEAEELEEIERILKELTDAVGLESAAIRHSVEIAGELDFIFAKGRLSLEWNCTEPQMAEDGWVSILSGRHPLLTGRVVPIDVWLGREYLALIITGPNTGGKTVTLKTVGLFTLMGQAGLHVPAQSGTELAVFDGIYADIGDEQSIEQNLSTFSSHMSNIVRILERATSDSLVLLDELGAGTDPTEGAALAMSILEHLIDLGCRTVATTHYSELKSFAFTEPAAENASVEFDVETLQPTFRLAIGVAGSSNAFAIARRLGLGEGIVERAKARLTQEEITVEELIRSVEENRRQAVRDREEAARLRIEMQKLRDRYDEAFTKLQKRRHEILDQARREAAQMVAGTRKELEQLIGELRRNKQVDLERAAQMAREQVLERQLSLREAEPLQPEIAPPEERTDSEPLHKGDTVRIRSLGQEAVVLAEPDHEGRVLVQAGMMRLSLMKSEVEKLAAAPRKETRGSSMAALARSKSAAIATELDLRGKTVDEALEEVDKYLDDCMLSGIPRASIIHGKGTGALRQAIREHLQGLPQIKAYREGEPGEGGSGVTIVEF